MLSEAFCLKPHHAELGDLYLPMRCGELTILRAESAIRRGAEPGTGPDSGVLLKEDNGLLRVTQQREQPVADQRLGGLVAGDKAHDADKGGLLIRRTLSASAAEPRVA